ncbi:longevity assurance proteins LAG1/LAC1 [Auriculariales sp. MPI-PUGE-AT-0066]|nr:longevity assurance proteins LAG1/LAC1 [Auriculariales sp. MPI-PUGE-AT-0066]
MSAMYASALRHLPSQAVPFFSLSYPLPTPVQPDSFPEASYYGVGPLDLCVVLSCVVALGAVRDASRLLILEPFARWYLSSDDSGLREQGVKTEKSANSARKPSQREILRERSVLRFAEQGYQFLYFLVFFFYSFHLHVNFPHSPWRLDNLWRDYPHYPLPASVKFHYLSQGAFWLHSVLVLHAEAHRADHWQMMTHHFVTIALMSTSYVANYTRVGCIILFVTGWCDILFPLAKMLRYLGLTTACDIAFGFFAVSWIITRQVLFSQIVWSVYHLPRLVSFKWDPQSGHYLTPAAYWGFLTLLSALLVMFCVWSTMMFGVVYKVLRGQPAEDTRSDDES